MESNVLIYDIETRVFGKPDPKKDILKIFGCYSYKTGKYYLLTSKEQIQKIVSAHKFLVGFNNDHYDNPIITRFGVSLKYKTIIDLRKIIIQRASSMKIKAGMLGDLLMEFSLDFITKILGLVKDDEGKKKIDYSMFMKDVWTPEELKEISEYTKRDIEVTKKLYEFIEEYFESFKDFLRQDDVMRKTYLTAGIAKFSYKAICKAMGWEERYGEITGNEDTISGGYVAYPAGEYHEGDIYCLDFNSLYPHIMIQCNLYGRKKEGIIDDKPTWAGGGKWQTQGVYYADEVSGVGKLLKKWYADRVKYKEQGDRREYTIKIIINTIYGILDNAYYTLVYDSMAGGDCTRIGRQWTKYARKKFRDAGYKVIYTDTDSVYIVDVFKDQARMLKVRDEIISDIKLTVPFPQETFDMGIDDEIKYMYFFKGKTKTERASDDEMDEDDFLYKPLGLLKKNYIYVTKDGKVKIKNLGIKKKSNSELSKEIFWKHLVPEIKEGQIKFGKAHIKNLMLKLLEEDIMFAALRKNVGNYEQYAKTSPNGLQAQIAKQHGAGIHFLIPNTKNVGVGKGKSYCTIEEYKERKLNIGNIDLSNVWKELDYFIKPVVEKNIFDF